jgi:NitT/TauT family transport system substrate-binding protein
MLLASLQKRGLPDDFWNLVNQSPEIGSTNLQAKRIDAHADFVPFPELLPFRGFARKIYDGAETRIPTFHGVVVRKDFAEKYPEIVVAYIEALMEANDWLRKNPQMAAEKIEDWTKINKEVAYIYLGPDGIMTLDPTIKSRWVDAMKLDYAVLQKLNLIKPLDLGAWVNDTYVRQAFKDEGMDYDKQLQSLDTYHVAGNDPICNVPVTQPAQAGQVWVDGGDIVSFSSPACTLAGVRKLTAGGKKLDAVYLVDHELGIKVFADKAFYSIGGGDPKKPEIVPFLLKRDAAAYAAKNGGKPGSYDEAIAAIATFGN